MLQTVLFVLIVAPFLAACACLAARHSALRNAVVLVTAGLLTAASVALFAAGPQSFSPAPLWSSLVIILDFGVLAIIGYIGFVRKSRLIQGLALAQLVPLAVFELFVVDHDTLGPALMADSLALMMVLIISIIGSLICVFAIPYMRRHEEHLHLKTSRQPKFFFFMLLFLGAMNGLVLSNSLLWVYFFFEVTTLCSFALIGHDDTEEARANALRALWMNSLGGLALVLGIIVVYGTAGSIELDVLLAMGPAVHVGLLGVALICLAGFVKAAQLPLQSWLLGAMVAPTPVSALLHSSTMVKAGVYLVLRLAPAYAGTFFSDCVALAGAATFLITAALAMGQSNGKKILAYSTISNLGLIIACAGLNTPEALAAAVLLILFHAVSKALLFLCVGTIEQGIESRDIEDMRGLFARMPRTAVITVVGVATMLLPPFGVLLSKWLAIEAAATNLPVVVMLALGSALGVVYWGRWAGMLMSTPFEKHVPPERLSPLTLNPLRLLAGTAVGLALLSPLVYRLFVLPLVDSPVFAISYGVLSTSAGAFVVYPLFFLLLAGVLFAWWAARKSDTVVVSPPYMSGVHSGGPGSAAFVGPMEAQVNVKASNYYLPRIFGEERLTRWGNIAAVSIIAVMLGGAL